MVDRCRRRPAAADLSVRAPRVASFPASRRPLSTCSAPPLPLPRAEAPSADESLRADLGRRLAFASSPHVPCPGVNQSLRVRASGSFALLAYYVRSETGGRHRCRESEKTLARRPTCFHGLAHACPLDPPCLAGCSPEPASHMPPIDFCNRVAPRAHPYERSEPGRLVLAKRPPAGSSSLGREEPAVLRRNQGSPGDASPYRLPHCDRSPYGFTPARPRVGHPHVAKLTPAVTGKSHRRLPAVEVPLLREDQRALAAPGRGLATTDGRGLPLGPLSLGPREWPKSRLHPGCLPPVPSSRRCAQGASLGEGRRLGRRVSPDRLSLPARHLFYRSFRGPDWVRGALGSTFGFFLGASAPPKRCGRFPGFEARGAWGVSAFGRSEG